MRRWSGTAVLALVLLFGCNANAQAKKVASQRVTACELLERPDRFDNKIVTIKADVLQGEELSFSGEKCWGRVTVEPPQTNSSKFKKLHLTAGYADFAGCFSLDSEWPTPRGSGAVCSQKTWAASVLMVGRFNAHPYPNITDARSLELHRVIAAVPLKNIPRGSMIPQSQPDTATPFMPKIP